MEMFGEGVELPIFGDDVITISWLL